MKIKLIGIQSRRMEYNKALDFISSLEPEKDEVIILPEKWITENMDYDKLNHLIDRINFENTIIPGIFSFYDGELYNRSFLIDHKKIVGYQDKINLYMDEKKRYQHGNSINIFKINNIKIGILICYDIDFPAYPRKLFYNNCDIIINPSLVNSKFHDEWHMYIKARSLENRIAIASINSISDNFLGDSIIVSPYEFDIGIKLRSIYEKNKNVSMEINTNDYYESRLKRMNDETNADSVGINNV